jgi:hypothetical protein
MIKIYMSCKPTGSLITPRASRNSTMIECHPSIVLPGSSAFSGDYTSGALPLFISPSSQRSRSLGCCLERRHIRMRFPNVSVNFLLLIKLSHDSTGHVNGLGRADTSFRLRPLSSSGFNFFSTCFNLQMPNPWASVSSSSKVRPPGELEYRYLTSSARTLRKELRSLPPTLRSLPS